MPGATGTPICRALCDELGNPLGGDDDTIRRERGRLHIVNRTERRTPAQRVSPGALLNRIMASGRSRYRRGLENSV